MAYRTENKNRNRNRNRSRNENDEELSPEVIKILDKIDKLPHWEKYSIDEITQFESGDAYIVANNIVKDRKPQSSQLRKFYDEALSGLAALSLKDLEDAKTTLSMLKPRVMYAKSREQSLVGITFSEFVKHATNLSKFRYDDVDLFLKDYQKFINFFESVVGYTKYINPRN